MGGVIFTSLVANLNASASELPKGNFEKYNIMVTNIPKRPETILQMNAKEIAKGWSSSGFKLTDGVYATGRYAPNSKATSVSPSIALPDKSGDEHIYLQINSKFETERNYDYVKVLYSEDEGKNYKRILRRSGSTDLYSDFVDITPLAGKSVNFKLELTSDESNEGEGWEIKNISIVKGERMTWEELSISSLRVARGADDDIDISSISSTVKSLKLLGYAEDDLPNKLSVYFSARDKNGRFVDMLDASNLQVKYNGQTIDKKCIEMAKITEDSKLPIDIAFLIDVSGSMDDEIKGVIDNVQDLVGNLSKHTTTYAGTYSYGFDSECPKTKYKYNGIDFFGYMNFDQNRIQFQEIWNTFYNIGGYHEPYYGILYDMINSKNLNYRANAQKVLILIGDESALDEFNRYNCGSSSSNYLNGNSFYTIENKKDIVNKLKENGFQLFTIVDNNNPYDVENNVQSFTGMAEATGGIDIDIENYIDFTEIFDKISKNLLERYVLTINLKSCNLEVGGSIEVTVGNTSSEIITPKVSPKGHIIRTNSTIIYDTEAINVNEANTTMIGAYVDGISNGDVERMRIYVKLDKDDKYIELQGVTEGADGWYGYVPSYMIKENAVIDYRFRAELTNGDYILSSPEGTEPYDYWTITVRPNTPPSIDENVSITKSGLCQPTTVSTEITDNGTVENAKIWYRKIGAVGDYSPADYVTKIGNTYYFEVPSSIALAPGFEYMISATDELGAISWLGTSENANRHEIKEQISKELSRSKERRTIKSLINDDCIHFIEGDELYVYFDNGCESDILIGKTTAEWNFDSPTILLPTYNGNGIKNGVENGDILKIKMKRGDEWFDISNQNTRFDEGDKNINVILPSTPSFKVYSYPNEIQLNNGQTEVSYKDNTDFGYVNSAKTYTYTIRNYSGCGDVEFLGYYINPIGYSYYNNNFSISGVGNGTTIENWKDSKFSITYDGLNNANATISLRYKDTKNNTTQDFKFNVSGRVMPYQPSCDGITLVNDRYNHGVWVEVTEPNEMLYIYAVDLSGKHVADIQHRGHVHVAKHFFSCNQLPRGSYYIVIEREGKPNCSNFITIE